MTEKWAVAKHEFWKILPVLLIIFLAWLLGLDNGSVALIIAILAWLRAGDLRDLVDRTKSGNGD